MELSHAILGGQNLFDGRANITAVAGIPKTDGLLGTQRKAIADDLSFLAPINKPAPGQCCTSTLQSGTSVPSVSFGGVPT